MQKILFVTSALAIALACSGQRDHRQAPTQGGAAGAGANGVGGSSGAMGGTSTGGTDDEGGATGTGAEPAGRAGAASGASGRAGAGGLGGSSGIASFGGVSGIGGTGGVGTAGSLGTAGSSGSAGIAGTAGQPPEPEGWLCIGLYGDGFCDCGCAVPDIDCGDEPDITACARCGGDSCSPFFCPGNIDPSDITRCTKPPPSWSCADPLWDDGSVCDCGCGYPDPDCSSVSADACDSCDEDGSCSIEACPGTIHPDMNSVCQPLPPPRGWTCREDGYSDGYSCDCGCGVPDLDCLTGDIQECDLCSNCGGGTCAQEVDAADTTVCLPAPDGWTCQDFEYLDNSGYCDCGCGIFDPNCEGIAASWCGDCPGEGCTRGDCRFLDPDDNALCMRVPSGWTCDPLYYDDSDNTCDCGCGMVDWDCGSPNSSACDICNSEGSCSTTPCPGTIGSTYNAVCGG